MSEIHRIDQKSIEQWLEVTEQAAYGLGKDNMPKQLRANRRGDLFVIVNGELKEHTRSITRAVLLYNWY